MPVLAIVPMVDTLDPPVVVPVPPPVRSSPVWPVDMPVALPSCISPVRPDCMLPPLLDSPSLDWSVPGPTGLATPPERESVVWPLIMPLLVMPPVPLLCMVSVFDMPADDWSVPGPPGVALVGPAAAFCAASGVPPDLASIFSACLSLFAIPCTGVGQVKLTAAQRFLYRLEIVL